MPNDEENQNMVDDSRAMTDEELADNTGLDKDTNTLHMKQGNMYLVFSSGVENDNGDSAQFGLSMVLADDTVSDHVILLTLGVFELLSTDPEILIEAGTERMLREAGVQTTTLQ